MFSEVLENVENFNRSIIHNKHMAFRRFRGRTKLMYFPKKTAVAISRGRLLKFDNAGFVTGAVGDTGERLVGISRDSWATTDTGTDPIAVEVPIENAVEWEIDTDSDGGATDTHVGSTRDLDTLGANVDVSASTQKNILITKRVSSTKVIGILTRLVFNHGNLLTT